MVSRNLVPPTSPSVALSSSFGVHRLRAAGFRKAVLPRLLLLPTPLLLLLFFAVQRGPSTTRTTSTGVASAFGFGDPIPREASNNALLPPSPKSSGRRIGGVAFGRLPGRKVEAVAAAAAAAGGNGSAVEASSSLNGLRVGLVGGGPAGLLLALSLLKCGASRVAVYEKRATLQLEGGRAYALGVGARGRTAIRSVSEELWDAVRRHGFESQRFDLYPPIPFLPKLRLRDEADGNDGDAIEPSLLLFQSSLCDALAQQLEREYKMGKNERFQLHFGTQVTDLNLRDMRITASANDGTPIANENFDLIVGCDGVNSIVRDAMLDNDDQFSAVISTLPGEFKTVVLNMMPPLLDPTDVSLLLPQKAGAATTAFVEPTANGTCCILFAGSNSSEPLLSSNNVTLLAEIIAERYTKLQGIEFDAAKQLALIDSTSKAKSVICNTYHQGGQVALVGDAAHATGGVSGQGVNSALMDSVALADALQRYYDSGDKLQSVQRALLGYSQKQVPEGHALYDLSFGPKSSSMQKRIAFGVKQLLDTLFKGKLGIGDLPLQTKLTTSLQSFADIRRERDEYYDENFPDETSWDRAISDLHEKMNVQQVSTSGR